MCACRQRVRVSVCVCVCMRAYRWRAATETFVEFFVFFLFPRPCIWSVRFSLSFGLFVFSVSRADGGAGAAAVAPRWRSVQVQLLSGILARAVVVARVSARCFFDSLPPSMWPVHWVSVSNDGRPLPGPFISSSSACVRARVAAGPHVPPPLSPLQNFSTPLERMRQ